MSENVSDHSLDRILELDSGCKNGRPIPVRITHPAVKKLSDLRVYFLIMQPIDYVQSGFPRRHHPLVPAQPIDFSLW